MKTSLSTVFVSILLVVTLTLPVFGQEPPGRLPEIEKRVQVEIEDVLRDIAEEHELLHGVLIEVQQVNEEMYRDILEEFTRHWSEFKMLKRENAELAGIEAEARAMEIKLSMLEVKYHQSPSKEEKAQVKEEMKQQLEELFQAKVSKREIEIARLEAELHQLRTELEQIVQEKEEHIERKLKQITQGDVFSW
jgi:hypothetical protein